MWTTCALTCLAGDAASWFDNVHVKGDLRLRYEGTDYDSPSKKDRNRGRFRLRLAAEKSITDKFSVGIRLASGVGEPTSTNQSFDDGFSGKEIWIDRVFVTYKLANGVIGAGKFANPFETTDMMWDSDVNPEGAYQSFGDRIFVNLGELVVEEQSSSTDSNLLAAQVGAHLNESRVTLACGYYHYTDLSDAGLPAAGNTGNASDFHIADVYGSAKLSDKIGIKGQVAMNLGEDAPDGVDDQDMAYAAYLTYGKAKQVGDWAASYKFAHIEPNAVVGAFADSDFGFADREGHKLSVTTKTTAFMNWTASILAIESIESSSSDFTRVQVDCSIKF